jgi:uncharacterized damage-inducible protein DinB
MTDPGALFLERSRHFLMDELMPRIREAVEKLSEDEVWWRPNDASNSVGNLLLHLSGNVRQWVVSSVGGVPFERRRQEEFAERHPLPPAELLERLEGTVREAADVLDRLDPAVLLEERTIQGRRVTVLEAIYHAVEHFSMHAGQIVYVAKLRRGEDLGFYEMVDGLPRARWTRGG